MIFYRIKNHRLFEKNRTRELKTPKWVAVPNKQDGDGYTELLDHENGGLHYGVWIAILLVASKAKNKWTLIRDNGEAHSFATLARMTRFPSSAIEEAFPRLIEIGWLEAVTETGEEVTEIPQESAAQVRESRTNPAGAPQVSATIQNNTIQDITVQNIISSEPDKPDSEPPVMVFPCNGKVKTWGLGRKRIQTLQELFPGIDVEIESRKALAWCEDNPGRRKTAKGMPTFLQNWMERNQNRAGGIRAGPAQPSKGGVKPAWLTEGDDEAD